MRKWLFTSFCIFSLVGHGQNDISVRTMLPLKGTMTTLQYTFGSESNWTWVAEAGYNTTGKLKSDEYMYVIEEGTGPGFGTGVRRYFGDRKSRFYAEVIGQFWFMNHIIRHFFL
jgi:hypothetical protein